MPRNMIWKSLATLSLACALSLGCGGDDDDGGGAAAGDGGAGGGGGDAAAGMTAVANRVCGTCHTGPMGLFAGNTALMAPNLTPHATGLAGWSEVQIATAILTGVDNEGKPLCASMQKYGMIGMGEAEAKNIAAYLKSIPPIANATPDTCQ